MTDAADADPVLVESTGHRTVMAKPSIVDDPSPALWARAVGTARAWNDTTGHADPFQVTLVTPPWRAPFHSAAYWAHCDGVAVTPGLGGVGWASVIASGALAGA